MISFPNCKINFGLRVFDKRKDGFHNIESVFIPVPWNDVLEVVQSDDFSFKQSGIEISSTKENLVVQAYRLLRKKYDVPHSKIFLLKNIPVGSAIHSVELQPGKGAQIARSAGASAQLVAKEELTAQIKMPSGEVRIVNINATASLGSVGNEQHQNVKLGKAGRVRKMGIRPTVRGVVMNAADHPHGGGDGGRHGVGGGKNHGTAPKTPWGQKTLGYKTRRNKSTDRFIVKSRHASKRR